MSLLCDSILLIASREAFPELSTGRPRVSHEALLTVFFEVLRTGMQWRAIHGMDYRTAHRHFLRWSRAGVFENAYVRIRKLLGRPRRKGGYLSIDSTYVKNLFGVDVVGRNPTDRGRLGTKVIAAVDEKGLPVKLAFCGANVSDHVALHHLFPIPRRYRGRRVYGDKGFDSKLARDSLRRNGLLPRIPKRGRPVAIWEERMRRIVERFFSWLDKCRRLIVRYDTTIAAYQGWTWMACYRLCAKRSQCL